MKLLIFCIEKEKIYNNVKNNIEFTIMSFE